MFIPKLFRVIFDYDKMAYCPGDEVSGKVEFELDQKTKIKGMRTIISGMGYVRWQEKQQNLRHLDVFYKKQANTIPDMGSGSAFSFPPGKHAFPFFFILPEQLPPSYEDDIGHIRYSVRSTMVLPRLAGTSATSYFTVPPYAEMYGFPSVIV